MRTSMKYMTGTLSHDQRRDSLQALPQTDLTVCLQFLETLLPFTSGCGSNGYLPLVAPFQGQDL